jgi:hypothetical protein
MTYIEVPDTVPGRTGQRPGSSLLLWVGLAGWLVVVPAHTGQSLDSGPTVRSGSAQGSSSPGACRSPSASDGNNQRGAFLA